MDIYYFLLAVCQIQFNRIRRNWCLLVVGKLNLLFYLLPVFNLERFKPLIFLIVFSKVVAVTFLILNAHLTPSAFMIYLAALGDGTMAAALMLLLIMRTKLTEKGA